MLNLMETDLTSLSGAAYCSSMAVLLNLFELKAPPSVFPIHGVLSSIPPFSESLHYRHTLCTEYNLLEEHFNT